MTAKTYEQAIGFLRIPESEEKLDNTDIHPEQYDLAKFVIAEFDGENLQEFFDKNIEKLKQLYDDVNIWTFRIYFGFLIKNGRDWKKETISTHKKSLNC